MSRRRRSRSRRPGERERLPRILIVTEGSNTEVLYFQDLCADHNLSSVDIDGSSDSNPRSVVNYGLEKFERDDEYDRLYCVFDRDRHDGFARAVRHLSEIRSNDGWDVYWTFSIPCFEYWILLHYTLTGRRFVHPDSPCGEVVDELEEYIPNYGKGMTDLYRETKNHLERAIGNARKRWKQAKGRGLDDYSPRTKIHQLVSYLRNLRSR